MSQAKTGLLPNLPLSVSLADMWHAPQARTCLPLGATVCLQLLTHLLSEVTIQILFTPAPLNIQVFYPGIFPAIFRYLFILFRQKDRLEAKTLLK
jgi:predicted Abi (CAAX) family protease